MITRRLLVTTLAAWLALSCAEAQVAPPSLTPVNVVTAVLNLVVAGKTTLDANYNSVMQSFFSDGMNADYMKAMSYSSDRPIMDGNPVTGQQNATNLKVVDVTQTAATDTTATVDANMTYQVTDDPATYKEKLTFSLVYENKAWRIDDVNQNIGGLTLRQDVQAEIQQGPGPAQ